jgi:hypothetical protein
LLLPLPFAVALAFLVVIPEGDLLLHFPLRTTKTKRLPHPSQSYRKRGI